MDFRKDISIIPMVLCVVSKSFSSNSSFIPHKTNILATFNKITNLSSFYFPSRNIQIDRINNNKTL